MNSPTLNRSVHDVLVNFLPVGDDDALFVREVIDSMAKVKGFFVWAMGSPEQHPEWSYSSSVALLGAFGATAFQYFASFMQEDPIWQHWSSCPTAEIPAVLTEAHMSSGYPLGLYLVDYRQLLSGIMNEDITAIGGTKRWCPRWFLACTALHIIKHTRLWLDADGQAWLFAAYKNNSAVIRIPPDGLHLPLQSITNLRVAQELSRVLCTPYSTKGKVWYEMATADVFRTMAPRFFPQARDVATKARLILSPAVEIQSSQLPLQDVPWVYPGVAVHNVAEIQPDGKITKVTVTGPDVLAYRWPVTTGTEEQLIRWGSTLPKHVTPERPSEFLFRTFRNINVLGDAKCQHGLMALLDATLLLNLYRSQLAGSPVGDLLRVEFPLMFFLPFVGTLEGSTNQGKTTLALAWNRTLEPRIDSPSAMYRGGSAPAIRSVAAPLFKFGTAVYDEFLLPHSPDHFLSQGGVQSLATGGTVTPGRAMENCEGVRLKYPLCFAAKVAPDVPDLLNRMIPTFLDPITPANTATEEELAWIVSGGFSLESRLKAVLYAEKTEFLTRIKGGMLRDGSTIPPMKIATGGFRFNATFAVALTFAARDSVMGYLDRAKAHCKNQMTEADYTGLADDIGVHNRFDPNFYWENADEQGLDAMKNRPLSFMSAMRDLITDWGKRPSVDAHLNHVKTSERSAIAKLQSVLRQGPLTRPGWRMEVVDARDDKGRIRSKVLVTKIKPEDNNCGNPGQRG
jgi:hypothetical protein